MTRKIKFRAFDGKTIRYDVTGLECGTGSEMDGVFLNGEFYRISETPLMQFTGTHDIHGNEIYEGDIVQSIKHIDGNFVERIRDVYTVVWQGTSFQYKPVTPCQYMVGMIGCAQAEVIGNIHQNQDLLKQR